MYITNDNQNFYETEDFVISNNNIKFEIGEQLGTGGNAAVYDCLDSHGNQYAIKFLLKFNRKIVERFSREIVLMKSIEHNHLIKYIDDGCVKIKTQNGHLLKCYFVVMEKADKNLLQYVNSIDNIDYDIYAPQFRGLSEALSVIHTKAIHRDIKPENILVKGEKWLISDYGLCSFVELDGRELTRHNEKIGPRFWMSPEAIGICVNSKKDISFSSDVFQLCAVFWFVVTKSHPTGILTKEDWQGNDEKIFEVVYQSLYHNNEKRPQNGDDLFQSFYNATILRG